MGLCPLGGEGKGGRGCFGGNSSLNIPEKKIGKFEKGTPLKKSQKKFLKAPRRDIEKKKSQEKRLCFHEGRSPLEKIPEKIFECF